MPLFRQIQARQVLFTSPRDPGLDPNRPWGLPCLPLISARGDASAYADELDGVSTRAGQNYIHDQGSDEGNCEHA